jgi:hypothetical protein
LREIVIADGETSDVLILYFGKSHKRSAECAPVLIRFISFDANKSHYI